MPRKEGTFFVEDYYANMGGLNSADSPFIVEPGQATDGYNYDYLRRGTIEKRLGHAKLNSSADTQLRSQGIGLFNAPALTRQIIRAAGTKIENFEYTAHTFTNLTEDTAAVNSDFLPGNDTTPVVHSMFNTATAHVLWMAGGGMSSLYGAYSGTKVTKIGSAVPVVGTCTLVEADTGGFLTEGYYTYSFAARKASTQAVSNCVDDNGASFTVQVGAAVTTGSVTGTVTFTGLDLTKYDKIYVYRSFVTASNQGSPGFTTGVLVQIVNAAATVNFSDTDTTPFIYVDPATVVPRAGSLIQDNSVLPAGFYKTCTVFKQRLVTASGSTVFLSNVNDSDSFPLVQQINVPSGGDITALAIIGFNNPQAVDTDEFLCIFKQREIWILTGDGFIPTGGILPNWSLKFVSTDGVSSQPVIVSAVGVLCWINYRGMFYWDGSGKPKYLSQPFEDKFRDGGDIDKTKLNIAWGEFIQRRHEIQWYVSSAMYGEQKLCLKLDVRLTFILESSLNPTKLLGLISQDVVPFSLYAGLNFIEAGNSPNDDFFMGDGLGFMYRAYNQITDAGAPVVMQYTTPNLNLGTPALTKRIHKVIVYVLDDGPYQLTLDLWADYKFLDSDASTFTIDSNQAGLTNSAIWDVSLWDSSLWDSSSSRIVPLVFNISSLKGNMEGDAFKLRFSERGTMAFPVIFGWSIYYTEAGLRK